jgi:dTDP-4-dehydrorhamnose 3,5-epimerase
MIDEFETYETKIAGLWQLRAKAITDDRGTVREIFRTSAFAGAGLDVPEQWRQVNLTYTKQAALRGLHGESVTKLVGVASGEAFGAYLDARPDSPSYGTVVTAQLTVGVQLLVPPGVCNGFQAVSAEGCQYLYCFDVEWAPDLPGIAVNPFDPELGIEWPLEPIASPKDASAPAFAELARR